jgi:hypothetical protein
LHARHHAQVSEEGEVRRIRHLQMLESMPRSAHRLHSHLCGSGSESLSHDPGGLIANDVKTRLLSGESGCGNVCRYFVLSQVGITHGGWLRVDIGGRQARGVGADRTIDEEIPRSPAGTKLPRDILTRELTPVADHLWEVRITTERESLEEIIGTADDGPAVLMKARNATRCCRVER